jgi:hypothetical protein
MAVMAARWQEKHSQVAMGARQRTGEYFRGGHCRSAETVYQKIESDVGYEKADREVTARFAVTA